MIRLCFIIIRQQYQRGRDKSFVHFGGSTAFFAPFGNSLNETTKAQKKGSREVQIDFFLPTHKPQNRMSPPTGVRCRNRKTRWREREKEKRFYVRLGDDIVVVSERNIPPRSNRRTGDL